MSVRIGDHEFEHAEYDESADVLYVRNGDRGRAAATTYGTPEGHAVRLDDKGGIIGITVVNARWLIEREGKIVISLPQQRLEATALDVSALLERV